MEFKKASEIFSNNLSKMPDFEATNRFGNLVIERVFDSCVFSEEESEAEPPLGVYEKESEQVTLEEAEYQDDLFYTGYDLGSYIDDAEKQEDLSYVEEDFEPEPLRELDHAEDDLEIDEESEPISIAEEDTSNTAKFVVEMGQVASDFQFGIDFVDDEMSMTIASECVIYYRKSRKEKAGYKTSDFFLDSLVGAIGKLTVDGVMPPHASAEVFTQINSFLRSNPRYNTDLAINLMNGWKNYLTQQGAFVF